jgi:hypothetical protein
LYGASWTNPGGGIFEDPANWNNGSGPVPNQSDFARFGISANYNVTFTSSPSIGFNTASFSNGKVTFVSDGGARTFSAGDSHLNSGSLTLTGAAGTMRFNPIGLMRIQPGTAMTILEGNDVSIGPWDRHLDDRRDHQRADDARRARTAHLSQPERAAADGLAG